MLLVLVIGNYECIHCKYCYAGFYVDRNFQKQLIKNLGGQLVEYAVQQLIVAVPLSIPTGRSMIFFCFITGIVSVLHILIRV